MLKFHIFENANSFRGKWISVLFYSNDHEPKHIHVEKSDSTAKYNIIIIELLKSKGFNAKELKQVREIIEENQSFLINKWDEFFSN